MESEYLNIATIVNVSVCIGIGNEQSDSISLSLLVLLLLLFSTKWKRGPPSIYSKEINSAWGKSKQMVVQFGIKQPESALSWLLFST